MNDIHSNWVRVQERVARAAEQAGRQPSQVSIVAVSKTRPIESIQAALAAGVTDLGENRVQEAAEKIPGIATGHWHLIGPLQRNKAGKAVELFDCIQSVDNLKLAQALARRADEAGKILTILAQVNTSGTEHQAGVAPEDLLELADEIHSSGSLRLTGLMTIAAFTPDTEEVRRCFRQLHTCQEQLAVARPSLDLSTLSMGMSGDFELAIEEGSTMVRIGTAIFGSRP
ncbi:MAG: YggS family pyridoxal phosphate-dependent enzyme [Gemmatimonadetes bacterium]|nr:YggS family pyridoxal phosphate-dependent enzyme [Gemmatimonadota bacterium]MBT7862965.1 YggS family pyridoxal phosphate-dependent enzyme [Gemmatimonadota bacterium]